MNLYPYGSGHLLVAPARARAEPRGPRRRRAGRADRRAACARSRAIQAAYAPDGMNLGVNLGRGRRRGRARPPPRARAAPLERRHQLHDRGRRGARAARGPARPATTKLQRGLARVASPRDGRRATSDPARASPTSAGDALPEDLDVTAYVGPYLFPDIRRRRIAGDDVRGDRRAVAARSGIASRERRAARSAA